MSRAKLTFLLPDKLQQEFRNQVTREGYGFRGKSRWVEEAVNRLLDMSNYSMLVNISSNLQHLANSETITVDSATKRRIEEAALTIRHEYPLLEGVQSAIIRTAMLQRLIRSPK